MAKQYTALDLRLFDGEGTGGAAAPAAGGNPASEAALVPPTRAGKKQGELANVQYGRAPAAAEGVVTGAQEQGASASGKDGNGIQTTSDTREARLKAYRDLVNSEEYKDIHTQETQRIIDRRFRETSALQQQVQQYQPVIDMLTQRYGTPDGDIAKLTAALEDDTAYWQDAADKAGMSVEAYKQVQKLTRENARLIEQQKRQQGADAAQRQIERWYTEGEAVKQKYPSFDLETEAKNPQFVSMLKSGVPVEHAYKVLHMDEIVTDATRTAAAVTEKRVVDNVRAKGARPQENGTASQSAFTVKDDVTKLTKKDRAEIARRAARGEIITF